MGRFNTQPPEGGWIFVPHVNFFISCFNTQPPEGGWLTGHRRFIIHAVSTHSRLKAAGKQLEQQKNVTNVSTHSRLKAAGRSRTAGQVAANSFNTQPPEGGWFTHRQTTTNPKKVSTHSRLKAAGTVSQNVNVGKVVSTHSRLKAAGAESNLLDTASTVSTHSRLKAAGPAFVYSFGSHWGFNTQPPEGGWQQYMHQQYRTSRFNTQPPEGGWTAMVFCMAVVCTFQHTAA